MIVPYDAFARGMATCMSLLALVVQGQSRALADVPLLTVANVVFDAASGAVEFDLVNASPWRATAWAVEVTGRFEDGPPQLIAGRAEDGAEGLAFGNEGTPVIEAGAFRRVREVVRRDGGGPTSVEVDPVAVVYENGRSAGDEARIVEFFDNRHRLTAQLEYLISTLKQTGHGQPPRRALADAKALVDARIGREGRDSRHTAELRDFSQTVGQLLDEIGQQRLDGGRALADLEKMLTVQLVNARKHPVRVR